MSLSEEKQGFVKTQRVNLERDSHSVFFCLGASLVILCRRIAFFWNAVLHIQCSTELDTSLSRGVGYQLFDDWLSDIHDDIVFGKL